ncbi:hypothetical protein ACWEVD_11200 [Nocardia thailandica]
MAGWRAAAALQARVSRITVRSPTKQAAVADAKKDADKKVPQGYYKRHCKEI